MSQSKKPKRGRPPIDDVRIERGRVRWSAAEWSEVESALAREDRDFSGVVRALLLRWAKRINGK